MSYTVDDSKMFLLFKMGIEIKLIKKGIKVELIKLDHSREIALILGVGTKICGTEAESRSRVAHP